MYGNKRQFWILDCTYWIPHSRYWIPDCLSVDLFSVFQSLVGFRIPWGKFRIAQAQISRITDFHKQKFSPFRNQHNLSWGDIKVFNKIKLKYNSVAFILEDEDQLVVQTCSTDASVFRAKAAKVRRLQIYSAVQARTHCCRRKYVSG